MRISTEELFSLAKATGFRAVMVEKVIHLLGLLEGFRDHPYLKGRWALKGGTALNVFILDLPRLSVDIDLNYIGAVQRQTMLSERPKVEDAIQAVCKREGLNISSIASEHAGGKCRLRYQSTLGQEGTLEVDVNYMFRTPLWPIQHANSRMFGSHGATRIPLLDIHELWAGKLAALVARQTTRDLFDVQSLLNKRALNHDRLRLAFVVYGAMNRKDWRTLAAERLVIDDHDLVNHLIPLVRADALPESARTETWEKRLVDDCRKALSAVLPFTDGELEFLDRLLDHGEIKPSLITSDEVLAERIARHPMLQWKALNVQRHQAGKGRTKAKG